MSRKIFLHLALVVAVVLWSGLPVWAGDGFVFGPPNPDPTVGLQNNGMGGRPSGSIFWTEERLRLAKPPRLLRPGNPAAVPRSAGDETESLPVFEQSGRVFALPGRLPLASESSVGPDPPPVETNPIDWQARQCPSSEYAQWFENQTTHWPQQTIGKLFFARPDGSAGVCTAATVGDNLIVTAGHCVATEGEWHTNFMFIPAYNQGLEPFGRWSYGRVGTFESWLKDGKHCRDVAFVTIKPNNGQSLGETVGHLGLMTGFDPAGLAWNQFGYPVDEPFDGQRLTGVFSGFGKFDYPDDCGFTIGVGDNMTAGASGGPWIYTDAEGDQLVSGLNSYGYLDCPENMYSPYFDPEVLELYQKMNEIAKSGEPSPAPPDLPLSPESGSLD